MLFLLYILTICFSTVARAQPAPQLSARSLDSLLQGYAFEAVPRPRPTTGMPYDGIVPSNLTGILVSALRLRSGSLRRKGVDSFKEFHIPKKVTEQPYVERLVLVYQNLGNWSSTFYPLPGYVNLSPVVGLLAYDASNLSAANLPELDIRAFQDPILVKFPEVKQAPDGSPPKCVFFGLHGSVEFNHVLDGSMCSTAEQGHFGIVVETTAPSPAPLPPPPPPPSGGGGKGNKKVPIIVGAVVVGLVLVVLLAMLAAWIRTCRRKKMIKKMERASEMGVSLAVTKVGNTKVPVATETRTKPSLENEHVP